MVWYVFGKYQKIEKRVVGPQTRVGGLPVGGRDPNASSRGHVYVRRGPQILAAPRAARRSREPPKGAGAVRLAVGAPTHRQPTGAQRFRTWSGGSQPKLVLSKRPSSWRGRRRHHGRHVDVTTIKLDADAQIEGEEICDVVRRGAAERARSQPVARLLESRFADGPTNVGLALCPPACGFWYARGMFEQPRRPWDTDCAASQPPKVALEV